MEARYNIYFAGALREGHELSAVRAAIASLFKADEATLARLFSGTRQLVKRDCDKATALKYKRAFESAGAVPIIQAAATQASAAAPGTASEPMTAAQRIAALAAAPDPGHRRQSSSGAAPALSEKIDEKIAEPMAESGSIQLAPEGTPVLLPQERQAPPERTVETPQLQLDTSGERLSATPTPPPPAPDTSHLSEGPVGELLPSLPASAAPLSPDTSGIALSPDGTDLSDCAAPAAAAPELDLSAIALAPVGADVLEAQYRKRPERPAPATDHLTLDD